MYKGSQKSNVATDIHDPKKNKTRKLLQVNSTKVTRITRFEIESSALSKFVKNSKTKLSL